MKQADRIRICARENYVVPARTQREKRFSIRAGDVVRDMRLHGGRTPAVCSALKTKEFLQKNALRLIAKTGPKSGQSTTVVYTYEFVGTENDRHERLDRQDAWKPPPRRAQRCFRGTWRRRDLSS